ncbi:MAG TPA: hypothetical protein VL979_12695 [Solirubrobacteraceae bacterium]|nr:hypothetical protein [Solirubrobacteraceae bacterium]
MRCSLGGLLAALAVSLLFAAGAGAQNVLHTGTYLTTQLSYTEVPIAAAQAVDASNSFGLARVGCGLESWGHGNSGALGDGRRKSSETPRQVVLPEGVCVASEGEAENAGFAIDTTGQLWGWGAAKWGVLCGEPQAAVPEMIHGVSTAIQVRGGGDHALIVLADGTLLACGENQEGQLGLGKDVKSAQAPTAVPGVDEVSEATAGSDFSCLLKADGSVWCAGRDKRGQAGGHAKNVYKFHRVALPGAASEVYCGGDVPANGSCVAMVEGVPYGWGDDEEGQLGDGGAAGRGTGTPVLASELAPLGIVEIATAGVATQARTEEGLVYAVGGGEGGALGTGSEATQLFPVPVAAEVSELSGTAKNFLALG